jgi:hypothetical protein
MRAGLDPFSFLVVSVAGWMNRRQHRVIEYLIEENRVLREQIGNRRMRFSDSQRRRLAAKAKMLGRQLLAQVATIVTPETLLAWHRKLIAEKYDGTAYRRRFIVSAGTSTTSRQTRHVKQGRFETLGPAIEGSYVISPRGWRFAPIRKNADQFKEKPKLLPSLGRNCPCGPFQLHVHAHR